jgi:hypothetical protein
MKPKRCSNRGDLGGRQQKERIFALSVLALGSNRGDRRLILYSLISIQYKAFVYKG